MEIQAGLHNEFDIIVRDAKTGEIKRTAKAYNIILNNFWTLFTNKNRMDNIQFGSGTTTPVATDTALTSYIGGKVCSADSINTSTFFTDGVIKRQRSIRLQDTEFVGSTISEVGFAANTSSNLTTKALVKDANGNAISITKNAAEVIDIIGTLYAKVITGDDLYFDGSNGNSSVLGVMLANWTTSSGVIPYFSRGNVSPRSVASIGDFDNVYSGSGVSLAWDSANKRLTYSLANLTAAVGNIGGFDLLFFGGLAIKLPRTGFAQPVLTKEVIATGNGTTKDFSCAFGLILNNGTAKLYVNDVEVPASFDYNIPNLPANGNFAQFLKIKSGLPTVATSDIVLENPYYQVAGIPKLKGTYFILYASNDQTTWTQIGSVSSKTNVTDVTVSSTYQNYRYWKITPYGADQGWYINYIYLPATATNKFIHATAAPAAGSTVALSYQPNCIAKDTNHVVNNMSVAITFNEYAP